MSSSGEPLICLCIPHPAINKLQDLKENDSASLSLGFSPAEGRKQPLPGR